MFENDKEKTHCPLCGEQELYRDIRAVDYQYKGKSITVRQPALWCDACGEGIIDGKDSKTTRRELQTFRAKIDGLLTPDEIRNIRKMLHLKQSEAGEIFGGGVNAFSRYENGGKVPTPLNDLLMILREHPEYFDEMKRRKGNNTQNLLVSPNNNSSPPPQKFSPNC